MKSKENKNKAETKAMHKTESQNNKKAPVHAHESAQTHDSVKNQAAGHKENAAKHVAGQAHSAEKHKRKP